MKKLFPIMLLLLPVIVASCNKDPVVTRSASSPVEEPAGISLSVEVPDTTHVINRTY